MTTPIRLAVLADQEPFLDLLPQLFEPPGALAPGYTRQRGAVGFAAAVQGDSSDVLLAIDGDQIIGFASVYADIQSIRCGQRCWLQDLLVHRNRRSEGTGAALLRAASDWARQRGCTHLELSSGADRTDAHRFYERQGMLRSDAFTSYLT